MISWSDICLVLTCLEKYGRYIAKSCFDGNAVVHPLSEHVHRPIFIMLEEFVRDPRINEENAYPTKNTQSNYPFIVVPVDSHERNMHAAMHLKTLLRPFTDFQKKRGFTMRSMARENLRQC